MGPTQCTEVDTTNWNVLDFVSDPNEVANYYWVGMNGDMPVFDPDGNMLCDTYFCTLVWIINFESKPEGERRQLQVEIPFKVAPGVPGEQVDKSENPNSLERVFLRRGLEESATQSRTTKVTAALSSTAADPTEPPAGGGGGDLLIPVVCLVAGTVLIVGFIVARRRKKEQQQQEESVHGLQKYGS